MATLAIASGIDAFAQLGINIETDRLKYVNFEPVRVTVTLRNYSGNTLTFGLDPETQGRLDFDVTRQHGPPVQPVDEGASPVTGLVLGAGETKTLTFSLNTLYDMQEEGTYDIYGQIGHPQLEDDFRSDTATVEIRPGTVIWTRQMGMPSRPQGAKIPSRQVSLLVFHDVQGDVYCLRVEDGEYVYRVVRLGRRVIGSSPECDVDAISSIHVLLPVRPRLFVHHVYDCDVRLKQERHYTLDGSAPHLHRDPDVGRIMVAGGRPAVKGVDFVLAEDTPEESGTERAVRPPVPVPPPVPPEARRKQGFLRRFLRLGRE